MNILLVSTNYLPFVGGVETHARQVAHEFSGRGHHVEIAAMNFAPARTRPEFHVLHTDLLAPAFGSYEENGVAVHSLAPRGNRTRIRLLPMAIRATPRLRRYAYHGLNRFCYRAYRSVHLPQLRALAQKADVVHSLAFGHLGWAAQEAAQMCGKPFVCTPFTHPNQWGDGPDDRRFYQNSDAVIALVNSDRDYLISIGVPKEQIHVVGVSPDLPAHTDSVGFRTRQNLSAETPLVLFIGRMTTHKGAASILSAAPHVWQEFPNTEFIFVGPASSESETWFGQKTDKRIRYLGKVSAQEKGDALAACDIFCMPSMSEILPTVYLEAWSLGKPVIGGEAIGLPQLVEGNKAGVTVSPDGVKVAGALNSLLHDSGLRQALGENGRKLVAEKYSVAQVGRQLEDIYLSVQTAKKAAASSPANRG